MKYLTSEVGLKEKVVILEFLLFYFFLFPFLYFIIALIAMNFMFLFKSIME